MSRALIAIAFIFLDTVLSIPSRGAQPYGLETRPDVGPYFNGVFPTQEPVTPSNWSAVDAFPNLTFLNPTGMLPVPGSGNKLIVWEREGRAYQFENNPTTTTKTLVFDISNQCQGWDDCGLLNVAFHPGFHINSPVNRYLYLYYVWVTPGSVAGNPNTRPPEFFSCRNRLSRVTLDAEGVAVSGSEFVIFDQAAGASWHHGGGMFFHPSNGFLHLTIGDDRERTMLTNQRIDGGLFAGMIRIDVDKRGGAVSHPAPRVPTGAITPTMASPTYYIPNDNPFVGVSGALEEFYAIGLRSPHRMTCDPVTGRIFIGDVGNNSYEEINTINPADPPGLNFQWNLIEGPSGGNNGDLFPPYIGVNRRPLASFPRSGGTTTVPQMQCIIGGHVYRGQQFAAELGGKYIFGDNFSGKIYYLNESFSPPRAILLTTLTKAGPPNSGNDYTSLSSFGSDANGEIYLVRMGSPPTTNPGGPPQGKVFKLQLGSPPSVPLPPKLSDTGAFTDLVNLVPSSKLLPFSVNLPFWSDDAVKTRWAGIPNGTAVEFAAEGEWGFPVGSITVKHFDLPVNDNNPAVRKRLETRFLVKTATGTVYGATYKWRPDNSDADLLDSSLTENIPIAITPLGSLTGIDIGAPTPNGSTSRSGDLVTIVAGGADIWNTSDQFHFAYQQRTGDFDITVFVDSLTEADLYTKAGLMARETLAANSRHLFAMVFPSNKIRINNGGGYEFQYRATTGGSSTAIYPTVPQPMVGYPAATWLRMRREGNTFIAYSSNNGAQWREFARRTQDMPSTLYFGLAVTAHASNVTTTANIELQNTRLQSWYFPSRTDCSSCHNSKTSGFLGLKTAQLNKDHTYPGGIADNELRSWAHVGLFTNPPDETDIDTLEKFPAVNDATATLSRRARSYLDANCSQCHRPGVAPTAWDARYDTRLSQQGIINGAVANTLGIPGAKVVVPQDLTKSMLYHRVNLLGTNQMPPLARNQIDREGVKLLSAWIMQSPATPTVSMTNLANGASFVNTDSITLTANAADADGEVDRVEFYDGNIRLGTDYSKPYSYTWSGVLTEGLHNIRAVVVDNVGRVATTLTFQVNVLPLRLEMSNASVQPGDPPGVTLTLTANLPSGRAYAVEWSDDLKTWNHFQNGITDGPVTVNVSAVGVPNRFYRLVLAPAP